MFAALTPVRQAYLNGLIASGERATVLSFNSLLGSSGAVIARPILGRVADGWSYPVSYVVSATVPRWRFCSSGWPAASKLGLTR
jgi:hypothetical protein